MIEEIRPITRHETMWLLLNVHYARRMPSVSYAYGLFVGDVLEGVVTYGTPPSATLRAGICGPDFIPNVLELNRLCFRTNRKNDASKLIGASLRMLPREKIIVSFADTEQGHTGKVYQATNFLYCGLSAKRTDWKLRGFEHLHGQTVADEFRGQENRSVLMREKYGDDFYLLPRPRKHRYVTFIGSKGFKAKARKALRYGVENYPVAIKSERAAA